MSFGPSEATTDLMRVTLEAAVPLWIERLKRMPYSAVMERARACGDVVAEKGDSLQFKGKTKKGRQATVDSFNALAEGLACLSFAPGGVRFLDLHFEAEHPDAGQG